MVRPVDNVCGAVDVVISVTVVAYGSATAIHAQGLHDHAVVPCRVVVLDALRQDGAWLAYQRAIVIWAPLGAGALKTVWIDEPGRGNTRPLG